MPELERISVEGFKSIRKLDDFELRSLNVLIGANASGKSNLIEIFELLRNVRLGNLQRYTLRHGGPSALMFRTHRNTDRIYANFTFGKNSYAFSLVPDRRNLVFEEEEIAFFGDIIAGKQYSLGSGHRESHLELESGDWSEDVAYYVQKGIRQWQVFHFHDTSQSSRLRHAHETRDNRFLRNDGRNIAPYLRFISM